MIIDEFWEFIRMYIVSSIKSDLHNCMLSYNLKKRESALNAKQLVILNTNFERKSRVLWQHDFSFSCPPGRLSR